VWGERNLGVVLDDAGTRRVRFCQRPDRLFTYYVEALRDAGTPSAPPADDTYWGLVRDGGLFADEPSMREDACLGLKWARL
jgi:hypothetical protein